MRGRWALTAVAVLALSGCGSDVMRESGSDVALAATTPGSSSAASTTPAAVSSATTSPASTPSATTLPATTPPAATPPATTPPAKPKPTTSPPGPAGITVTTGGSDFGEILYDGTGQAIYLFDLETSPQARCYGGCAIAWPPVLTDGPPQAAGAARSGLLGSTQRDDGTTQVTYAGHPLYYYVDDGKNEVLCHDVVEFGGLWLVVTPAGGGGPH